MGLKAIRLPWRDKNACDLGFSSDCYVNPTAAKILFAAGHRVAFRYVNRSEFFRETPDDTWPFSISAQELRELTDMGFYVALTQWFAYGDSIAATEENGARLGRAATFNAAGIGYPQGAHIFLDMEWSRAEPAEGVAGVINYEHAFAKQVRDAGYKAGVYVGCNSILSGDQLYYRLVSDCYWKSCSSVPTPITRGYSVIQGGNIDIHHSKDPASGAEKIDLEPCLIRTDELGGRPYVAAAG